MPQLPGESKAESMLLDRLEARIKAKSLTLQAMSGRWSPAQRLRFTAEFNKGTDIVIEKLQAERDRKREEEQEREEDDR